MRIDQLAETLRHPVERVSLGAHLGRSRLADPYVEVTLPQAARGRLQPDQRPRNRSREVPPQGHHRRHHRAGEGQETGHQHPDAMLRSLGWDRHDDCANGGTVLIRHRHRRGLDRPPFVGATRHRCVAIDGGRRLGLEISSSLSLGGRQRDDGITFGVHDDHLSLRLLLVPPGQPVKSCMALPADVLAGKHCERSRIAGRLGAEAVTLAASCDHPEGNLQHDQHDDCQQQVRGEQPPAEAQPVCPSRKPTPRTVSIHSGCPSRRRRDATCTSRVFVGPYQCESHTSSNTSWRFTMAP